MNSIEAKKVINGTWGSVSIDGDELAEVISLKATLTATKAEVKMVRHLVIGQKVTGYQGKGSVKVHKVSSYFMNKLAKSISEGKQISFTIISKLADPDANGEERIVIRDANPDGVDLANWEVDKLGEEDISFSFSDFEIIDSIE
jgi:hypothetical protein